MQETQERRFDPWVWKIPWGWAWQPTPVFLPGESHGQRSLVGYSPWGCKESDTTERVSARAHTHPSIKMIQKTKALIESALIESFIPVGAGEET